MINGNIRANLQRKTGSTVNAVGEKVQTWSDTHSLWGWLDLSNGDSMYINNAKLQESTHVFVCDYVDIDRKASDKRLIVNGDVYDVMLIDDPMELHQQLEIYLRYVGW